MPNFIIIIIAVLVLAWILTIPGLILLRLFKIRFTDHIEHLLYSIGVSIFLDIVIGLIINYAFLLFNSDHTFTPDVIRIVWGAIFVISSLMIIVFRKHISFQLQRRDFVIPGLIYLVTVIILYQTSLLTQNLIGSDIHLEYFYANQVVSHQYSDLSVFRTINICLPITIFLPMYSMLVGMDMMWVFKIIEPLILGVLPVVVYQIYKTQFNKRVSIIATVFIFTLPLFTMDIAQLIRQQYAMLFLVILVLLLINRDQAGIKKIFLCSLLGVGVIISHYGLGVGLLCYLGIGFIVMCILKMRFILIVWQKIIGKLHTVPVDVTNSKSLAVWGVVTVICCVSGVLYYVNMGSGVANINALQLPVSIMQDSISITSSTVAAQDRHNDTKSDDVQVDQPNIEPSDKILSRALIKSKDSLINKIIDTREPLLLTVIGFDFMDSSVLGKVWRVLQYLVEIFLMIGVIRFIFRPNKNIRIEYIVLTVVNVCMIIGAYVLPGTSSYGMGAPRIIMMMLLFTAPFFVYGIDFVTRLIVKLLRCNLKLYYLNISCIALLAPYILFNSGAIFEIIKYDKIDSIDIPFSSTFSGYRLDMNTYFSDEDIVAMRWLDDKVNVDDPVFADTHGWKLAMQNFEYDKESLPLEVVGYAKHGYVFLRKWNVDHQVITVGASYGCRMSIPFNDFAPKFGWVMKNRDGTTAVYISTGDKPMEIVLSYGNLVYNNGAMIYQLCGKN